VGSVIWQSRSSSITSEPAAAPPAGVRVAVGAGRVAVAAGRVAVGVAAGRGVAAAVVARVGDAAARVGEAAGVAARVAVGEAAARIGEAAAGEAATRGSGVAVGGGVDVAWVGAQAASNRARVRDNGANNRPTWRIIKLFSPVAVGDGLPATWPGPER
jgi:hypothetical protein